MRGLIYFAYVKIVFELIKTHFSIIKFLPSKQLATTATHPVKMESKVAFI